MTNESKNSRIRYDEGCLAAHALNVIGDRWALLVVRELMFSGKRFQMLRAGMPGISAAVLTQRLNQLIEAGIITHNHNFGSYELTPSGQGLLPVLQALCRWGAMHPGHDPRRFISPSALLISMTSMINHDAAKGKIMAAGFQFKTENFAMTLTGDGVPQIKVAAGQDADFIFSGDGNNLAIAVYGPHPLSTLTEQGLIKLDGDIAKAQNFVDLFSLS